MLNAYRRALELPGAWRFSAAAFVGRLPIAMIGLGIVLLISTTTGSYAQAGVLGAIFQLSAAGGAIVTSRWADRSGQGGTLVWLSLLHATALVAFVISTQTGQPLVLQALLVGFAGLVQPAIGSMVRARWAHASDSAERLRSAFAIESIVDEAIFTIGPMITAWLAFSVGLSVPLVLSAALTVAGSLALAAQRSTAPPPRSASAGAGAAASLRGSGLPLMVLAALGLGAVFGTYEVTVVAFTENSSMPGSSGFILGLWALGSMVGGIIFGARQWRVDLPLQVVILTGILAIALLASPFASSVPALAVSASVSAFAVAPSLIAVFSLTERLVHEAKLTEGLTWTNSGLAVGFSLGTAVNGFVIDAAGTTVAFWLPSACAAFACLTSLWGLRRLRSSMRPPSESESGTPGIALNTDPLPGPTPGGVIDNP